MNISRQSAIAEIYDEFMTIDGKVHDRTAKKCMDILQKLPSVHNSRNTAIEHRITEAMQKQEARTPNVQELGGGYYFTCFWASCGKTLDKYWDYCPYCGQRIDWTDAKEGGYL